MASIDRNVGILSISDEILLEIIKYLKIEDCISLSQSCSRFDRLLMDKSICRRVHIPWNCNIESCFLSKFLRNNIRSTLITYLNINDVYWLHSNTIRIIARKLKNLKDFHVAGTQLSWKHLTSILSVLNLEGLSWTYDRDIERLLSLSDGHSVTTQLNELKTQLGCLTKFLLQIPDWDWNCGNGKRAKDDANGGGGRGSGPPVPVGGFTRSPGVTLLFYSLILKGPTLLISHMVNLEELWIVAARRSLIETTNCASESDKWNATLSLTLPKLHTFIYAVDQPSKVIKPYFVRKVLKCFQTKGEQINTNSTGTLARKIWVDQLPCDPMGMPITNRHFGEPGVSLSWPNIDFSKMESFSLPLSDTILTSIQPLDLANCKHLVVLHGISEVIPLHKYIAKARNLLSFCSKAFNIKVKWDEFVRNHPKIAAFNISEDDHLEDLNPYFPDVCVCLGSLANLQKVSLPVYALFEVKSSAKLAEYQEHLSDKISNTEPAVLVLDNESTLSTLVEGYDDSIEKRKRISRIAIQDNRVSGLDYLTLYCPHIVELEIGFTKREIGRPLILGSLGTIGRLEQLKKLTLDTIPIQNGRFLKQIGDGCKVLESLRLRNLGSSVKCVYINELCSNVKSFKYLKDFRLEQKYIGVMTTLLNALKDCEMLERIYIEVASNFSLLEKTGFVELMENCTSLVVLYVIHNPSTKVLCKELEKEIKYLFGRFRQALDVIIQCSLSDPRVIIPSINYRKLVVMSSQVVNEIDFPTFV